MRLIAELVFAFLLSATALADPRSIPRLAQLIIPELNLKEASLEEALEKVKTAWQQKYKDEAFPVVVVTELHKPAEPLRYTAELKKVPALKALTYIATGFEMEVRHELDMVYLRQLATPFAILQSTSLYISPRAGMMLGFQPTADDPGVIDVRKHLEKLGIELDGECFTQYDHGYLYLRARSSEVDKVRGILLLIESGYSIKKEPVVK